MPENQATINNSGPRTKKVPLQERAITAGNIVGINAYPVNLTMLKHSLVARGYHLYETPHFLLFIRAEAPTTIVAHRFAPQEVDASIGDCLMRELKPFGLLVQFQDFENLISAVVCSLFPRDVQQAWHLYAINTLQRYHDLLNAGSIVLPFDSAITSFAAVYQRVFELQVGKSFLDAGCSFGFLSLLVAERFPTLSQVVGIDILTDSFPVVRAIAKERQLANVEFTRADLLADDFNALGLFDTVVALHILEHFKEPDMFRVLINLLKVTTKRLVLAVPYEQGEPEQAYGHEQLFTPAKLEAVGHWCVEQLDGSAQMSYEDCAGGLLLIERQGTGLPLR